MDMGRRGRWIAWIGVLVTVAVCGYPRLRQVGVIPAWFRLSGPQGPLQFKDLPMHLSTEHAETLALKALTWLVGQEDLLPVFLGSSGASERDVRDRAGDPEFLGSVLDFLLMDEAWVIAFCDTCAVPYAQPMQARAALPGGAQVHWT